MANHEHLKILFQGVEEWNAWRGKNPNIKPDLKQAYLIKVDLTGANLSKANLTGAYLTQAVLIRATLSKANLRDTMLTQADLSGADLTQADLSLANLSGATLAGTTLEGSKLSGAMLINTNFTKANLSRCSIYAISAWDVNLDQAKQLDLIITRMDQPVVTVDNLQVAQFIYLLLNNENIRQVIDTIGEKGVLILGRFTEERKLVLDAIRDQLRILGFVPMMFDFEKPTQKDFTETIKTLAGLSRFVIADITDPKSVPLELQATIPYNMIPFVPICQDGGEGFSMFLDLKNKYSEWVLDILEYDTADNLITRLDKAVVRPALKKADELVLKKAEGIRKRHIRDKEYD